MDNRAEYQREYQRRMRAENPERAREASRRAYAIRKAREAKDASLRERRLLKAREWQLSHLKEKAQQARRYYDGIRANPERLARLRARRRQASGLYRREERNRAKVQARWTASKAMQRGKLKRLPCRVCGELRSEMHHADYDKPLDVVWLCKSHHEAAHSDAA